MTDSITVFQFSSNDVRVLILDNEPWFIGADVCKILDIRNTGDAYSRLRDCEKRNLDCSQVIGIADNPDIKRLTAISEPGLYRLIMTSRKPEAEPFQDWVCQEVLPQIRKTGSYQQQPKTQLQILADMAQALVAQEEAMLKMQLEQQLQAQKLSEIESLTHQHDGEIDRIFNPNGHYFSVTGYFSKFLKQPISIQKASAIGKRCSRYCREHAISIEPLTDPRFGEVNSYPEDVIKMFA